MKLRLFSLVICLAAITPSFAQQNYSKVEKEVNAHFLSMLEAAEELNNDKLDAGVDDSLKAGFVSNNVYYKDFAKLLSVVKVNSKGVSKQEVTINTKKITELSTNLALVTCHGIANASLDDGRQFSNSFCWSFVYKKINGAWKVIHSHQSAAR